MNKSHPKDPAERFGEFPTQDIDFDEETIQSLDEDGIDNLPLAVVLRQCEQMGLDCSSLHKRLAPILRPVVPEALRSCKIIESEQEKIADLIKEQPVTLFLGRSSAAGAACCQSCSPDSASNAVTIPLIPIVKSRPSA